jgi:ubiquinone/menaquinone biosynthesis C-methylase UbiE
MGCGLGQFISRILDLRGNIAIGTDVNFNVLKKAYYLLNNVSANDNFNLINQDTIELPFKDDTFDYVLLADVLEHVGYNNQEKVMLEVHRVLRKSGHVIIHTPNLNRVRLTTVIKKFLYIFKGIAPSRIKHSFPKDHISLTTSKILKTISEHIGFNAKVYYQTDRESYYLPKKILFEVATIFSRSFVLVLSKNS